MSKIRDISDREDTPTIYKSLSFNAARRSDSPDTPEPSEASTVSCDPRLSRDFEQEPHFEDSLWVLHLIDAALMRPTPDLTLDQLHSIKTVLVAGMRECGRMHQKIYQGFRTRELLRLKEEEVKCLAADTEVASEELALRAKQVNNLRQTVEDQVRCLRNRDAMLKRQAAENADLHRRHQELLDRVNRHVCPLSHGSDVPMEELLLCTPLDELVLECLGCHAVGQWAAVTDQPDPNVALSPLDVRLGRYPDRVKRLTCGRCGAISQLTYRVPNEPEHIPSKGRVGEPLATELEDLPF